jgi:membrane protein DedA with SNARE-associated domain
VFDWLTHEVSHSVITYPVVGFAAGADVLLPLIPSETIVITAGVLAAQGELLIWLIVPACSAAGSATRSPTASSLTRRGRRGCSGQRKRCGAAAGS